MIPTTIIIIEKVVLGYNWDNEKVSLKSYIFFIYNIDILDLVPVNLTQLVGTLHNICKGRGSNPEHHISSHLNM